MAIDRRLVMAALQSVGVLECPQDGETAAVEGRQAP